MFHQKIMAALAAGIAIIGYATAQEVNNTQPPATASTSPNTAAAGHNNTVNIQNTLPLAPNPALKEAQPVKEPEKGKTTPATPVAQEPEKNKTPAPAVTSKPVKKGADPQQLEKRVLYQYQMENPTQYNNLMQLKKTNPIKYKDDINKLVNEQQKKLDDFNQMVDSYKKTRSPELKNKIRKQIAEGYDRQLKWEKTKIDWLENETKKCRDEYRKHVDKRDRTVDEQLDKILLQRAQQW